MKKMTRIITIISLILILTGLMSCVTTKKKKSEPLGENLAAGKTVVTSSIETEEYLGDNVVDGSTRTRWASLEYQDPEWIYIDLGSKIKIDRVILKWEAAYAVKYLIQVSDDAETWTDVYKEKRGDGKLDDITIKSKKAVGQYIRMFGTERGSDYGYSLYEFEVYGTPAE